MEPEELTYWKKHWEKKAKEKGYDVDCLIDHLRPEYDKEGITLDEKQELIIYMRLCCSKTEARCLLGITNNKTFTEYLSKTSSHALKTLVGVDSKNKIFGKFKNVTWENFKEIVKEARYYNESENEQEILDNLSIVFAVIDKQYQNGKITKEQMLALREDITEACE